MGINLPRPSKKNVIIAAIIIIGLLGALWYLGRKNEVSENALKLATAEQAAANQEYYQQLVNRTVYLRNLAGKSLFGGSDLKSLPVATNSVVLYEEVDLKLTSTENEESWRKYGEGLGKALEPYGEARENESQILITALDKKSEAELRKLQDAKSLHENTINKLLTLTVPKSAAELHVKLLNNLASRSLMLGNMLQAFTEPLLALESAQAEYQAARQFYQLTGEINQYFRTRGVTFDSSETVQIYQTI